MEIPRAHEARFFVGRHGGQSYKERFKVCPVVVVVCRRRPSSSSVVVVCRLYLLRSHVSTLVHRISTIMFTVHTLVFTMLSRIVNKVQVLFNDYYAFYCT